MKTKRLLVGFLSLLMVLALMPAISFAKENVAEVNGKEYSSLAEAFAAATGGTEANPIEIKVLVDELPSFVLTTDATAKPSDEMTDAEIQASNYQRIPDHIKLIAKDGGTTIKGHVELNGAWYFTMTGFTFDAAYAAQTIAVHHSTDNPGIAKLQDFDSSVMDNSQDNNPKSVHGNDAARYILFENCIFSGTYSGSQSYTCVGHERGVAHGNHPGLWSFKNCTFITKNAACYLNIKYINGFSETDNAFTVEGCTFGSAAECCSDNLLGTTAVFGLVSITNNTFNGAWGSKAKALSLGAAENKTKYVITGNTFNYTGLNTETAVPLQIKQADYAYVNGNTVTCDKLSSNQIAAIAEDNTNLGSGTYSDKKLVYKYQKTDPVAAIGTTKYKTLQAAITAASQMERSADNRVTIDIIGTCESLSSGADIQYVTFKGHEGGSMNGYQASTNAKLKGTHFEYVTFNGTFQIQACNNTCDDDIVFSNCTFNGSNTAESAIMIQRYETQTINNLTLTRNNFKKYTKSAVVLNLSGKTSLDSRLFVYNNTFDNIGYNAVQALNFDRSIISENTVTNTASSAFNINGCKNTTVINNTVDLKDDKYAVKNVTGMTYLIGNTLTKGTSKISDFGRNAEVKAGGTATLDAYIDIESGKVYGGLVLKNSTEELAASEMKTGCSAAKIGEGLYLVGVDAVASSYKLTGGFYIDNPLPYVAEDYTVQPSGNQDYPYEVIKLKSGEKEKKEIVVEQKTEPVISGKIEEPAEIAVATAVLEDTKVTGVADALTEKGKDKIIRAAIDDNSEITKEIIDDARMVDISITVEAEVIAVQTVTTKIETEKVIEFELSPYAIVTATASDGTQVSSDVIKVDNAYLAKTETKAIKVVLGSEFEPKQAVHIREDGVNEVFEKGTKASYADRTFVYDKEEQTVTLEITQFSVVKLLADEKYATVAFDANGGTGTIESVSVEKGTKITLPENSFKAPSGKKFKTWSINGQTYNPGSQITVKDNITVKAEWEDGVVTGDFTAFWGYLMIAGFALAAVGYGLMKLGKKRRQ